MNADRFALFLLSRAERCPLNNTPLRCALALARAFGNEEDVARRADLSAAAVKRGLKELVALQHAEKKPAGTYGLTDSGKAILKDFLSFVW